MKNTICFILSNLYSGDHDFNGILYTLVRCVPVASRYHNLLTLGDFKLAAPFFIPNLQSHSSIQVSWWDFL